MQYLEIPENPFKQVFKNYFALLLLLAGICIHAQTAVYQISMGGFKIGEQTVVQKNHGDTTWIDVNSSTKLAGGLTTIKLRQHTRFINGELEYSSVVVIRNGKIYSTTTTQKNGSFYNIQSNGKRRHAKLDILYSGSQLYFQEPTDQKSIYIESDGLMKRLKNVDTHSYEAYLAQEKFCNRYYYKNGILQRSDVHLPLISFQSKLISLKN